MRYTIQKEKKASEIVETIRTGYMNMIDFPEKYEAMNPENGWGSYNGAMSFLVEVLMACRDNPDAIIRISK